MVISPDMINDASRGDSVSGETRIAPACNELHVGSGCARPNPAARRSRALHLHNGDDFAPQRPRAGDHLRVLDLAGHAVGGQPAPRSARLWPAAHVTGGTESH